MKVLVLVTHVQPDNCPSTSCEATFHSYHPLHIPSTTEKIDFTPSPVCIAKGRGVPARYAAKLCVLAGLWGFRGVLIFPEGLKCGLEKKLRVVLRLTSLSWWGWLSFKWDGLPSHTYWPSPQMDKQTKVDSAAEMSFLPLVPFLAVYWKTHTYTHNDGTAECFWMSMWRRWFILFYFISVKMPVKAAKSRRQTRSFLFSVTSLVSKLFRFSPSKDPN